MNEDRYGDQAFRAPSLYGRQEEMTYGGALSLLRRRYTREIEGADVVVSGIPYDGAATNRSGTRLGPRAIRGASTQLAELDAFPWGFDPFATLAVADYGDCFLDPGYPERITGQIAEHARGILGQRASMLTLGGDHYVTYPLLQAHAERHGPLALVQFDAHPDTWPDDRRRIDHGTMIARGVHEGLIDPAVSLQLGIRTHGPSVGFTVLDAPWIHAEGSATAATKVIEVVGQRPAYLSFDIDCLDPAFAPGTGTPVAGGLSSAQALAILRALGGVNWVGMDVVEVAPAYDTAEITALAAATLAHDYLCLLAYQRRSG